MPRKFRSSEPSGATLGFNEAAATMPRKSRHCWQPVPHASMRPRQRMPRKSESVETARLAASMRPRQRCRGSCTCSTYDSDRAWRFNEAAATMPRKSAGRSYVAESAHGFNEAAATNAAEVRMISRVDHICAASMRPRQRCRGSSTSAIEQAAAEATGFNEAAATMPRKYGTLDGHHRSCRHASMRPRQRCRGS